MSVAVSNQKNEDSLHRQEETPLPDDRLFESSDPGGEEIIERLEESMVPRGLTNGDTQETRAFNTIAFCLGLCSGAFTALALETFAPQQSVGGCFQAAALGVGIGFAMTKYRSNAHEELMTPLHSAYGSVVGYATTQACMGAMR